jgi:hypothetical protein
MNFEIVLFLSCRCVQFWIALSENINAMKIGVVVELQLTKWGLWEAILHLVEQTEQQPYHSLSTSIRNRRRHFLRLAHWHAAQLKPFSSTQDEVFSTITIKGRLVHGTLKTESKVSMTKYMTWKRVMMYLTEHYILYDKNAPEVILL